MVLPLGFFVLALGFLMVGHYSPWAAFEQQWVAALGAGLLCWGAPRVLLNERQMRVTPIAAVAAGLATVPILQYVSGLVWFRSDAVLPAAYMLGFAACIVCGRTLAIERGSRMAEGLMGTLLTVSVISTAIALVQWQQFAWSMFVVDLERGGRPYGNLAQPNHQALLLGMGAVFALGLYERRRFTGLTASVTLAFLGFGLVMTQARAAWLFVGMVTLWWLLQRRRCGLRLPWVAVVVGLTTFIAGVYLWGPLNEVLLLSVPSLETRLMVNNRPALWATLLDAAWREPWLGYGWSQVTLAQQAAALNHPATGEWLMQSHNLILDLILQNGIPVGLAVVGFLALWVWRQARSCNDVVSWALLGAVGLTLLHSMVEFPLDYTYFLFPTGLAIGLLEGLNPSSRWTLEVPRTAWSSTIALLLALLAWIGAEYLQVSASARQLRFVMAGIGVDKVRAAPPPDVWLLDEPRDFHRYWMTPAKPSMGADELEWMRRISTRHAAAPAMLRFALAAGLNGQANEAERVLARLCRMNSAKLCDEGRESWRLLQHQHRELRPISYPATPRPPWRNATP